MSIEVEGPDGAVHEFPEGTDPAVIKGVMAQRYGKDRPAQEAPGMWDAVKTQAGKAGQAADDMARLMANGATLGMADRLAAWGNGTTADAERAKSQEALDRAGVPGHAAEILGSVAPTGLFAKGTALAANSAGKAAPVIAGLLANPLLQAGVTGGSTGAVNALATDSDLGSGVATGMAGGVVGQGLANALSAGVKKVAGAVAPKPKIPTLEEVEAAKKAAYQAADDAGVIYTPQLFQRVQGDVIPTLTGMGYTPKLQPRMAAVLEELDKAAAQGNAGTNYTTLTGADTIRKIASNAYEPGNNANNAMVRSVVSSLDNAMSNPAAGDYIAGNAKSAGDTLMQARNFAARQFKAERVAQALEEAQFQAARSGSGGNVENAMRQQLDKIRRSPSESRGYTPDEMAALESAVSGSTLRDAARLVGKLSPEGNGLMLALHTGATAVNPVMALAGLVGYGSKKYAENLSRKSAQELSNVILAGGSKSALQPQPGAIQSLADSKRDALARALMAGVVLDGNRRTAVAE